MEYIKFDAFNTCRAEHLREFNYSSFSMVHLLNSIACQTSCNLSQTLFILTGFVISTTLLMWLETVRTQFFFTRWQRRLAPGPRQYPVIGSLLLLRPNYIRWMLTSLPSQYGAVCRLAIGVREVVVLSGWKTLRNALIGRQTAVCYAGRPNLYGFRLASSGLSMSFNSYSAEWRIHRQLAEKGLTVACAESNFIDNIAAREALILVDEFLARDGSPFVPGDVIARSVGNTMYSLCYGDARPDHRHHEAAIDSRCEGELNGITELEKDREFEEMIRQTRCLIEAHNTGNAVDFFPWAKHLLRGQLEKLDRTCAAMLAITRQKLSEHVETYQPDVVRDVIDALIGLSQTRTGRRMDAERLALTVQEFLGAGLDILQAALHWVVLYIAEFPRVQDKVRLEVDSLFDPSGCCRQSRDDVVGETDDDDDEVLVKAAVTSQVLAKLPYTESVILEVLRHSSVVPLGLPHSTLAESKLNGYDIPAKTFVLTNLYSASHDPELWTSPKAFVPERFMQTHVSCGEDNLATNCNITTGTGNRTPHETTGSPPATGDDGDAGLARTIAGQRADLFPAFGFGKRRCIGEQLSRLVLTTYLASLVRNCYIDRPPGTASIDLEPVYGIVLRPKPNKVVIRRRRVHGFRGLNKGNKRPDVPTG